MGHQHHLTLATTVSVLCLIISPLTATTSVSAQSQQDKPSTVAVQTTSGLVQGIRAAIGSDGSSNNSKQTIYKFLSVPYAQAPVGRLRFQRPVELDANSTTLVDATKFGKTCPQYRHLARFISPLLNLDHDHQTSEDCLSLSIYVPAPVLAQNGQNGTSTVWEPSSEVPVIVWIPGEGFDFADARQFDGSHLAQRTQSIVVSVQYRVGILGFMEAPQLNITGNMGVYDQLAALRWIKKNIGSFGGDSERVTLMGRFSGSMAISTLLTAPNKSLVRLDDGQPLFNRAILLSGLAVGDWIIERHGGMASKANAVGELALERNYCTARQVAQGSCLQDMPVERLLEISGYAWKLTVDNELIGQLDPIESLAADPDRLSASVDAIMLGETDTEGTLCLYRHMLDQSSDYAQLIEENRLTPGDLYELLRDDSRAYFGYNISRSNPIQMALEAISASASASDNNNKADEDDGQLRASYLDACSSYMVKSHNSQFRRHLEARNRLAELSSPGSSAKKPVELYHYSLRYKPSFSLAPEYIRTGAHGDDVPLIFGLVYNQPAHTVSQSDLLMTQQMMSYIGNFVHNNHPLLQQHNSIFDQSGAVARQQQQQQGDRYEDNRGDDTSEVDHQAVPSRPLSVMPTQRFNSWASTSQVHLIDLVNRDQDEQQAIAEHQPKRRFQRPSANTEKGAETLARLVNWQQQARHSIGGAEPSRASQLKVVLMDGQQIVGTIATNGLPPSESLDSSSQLAEEQTQLVTRSQRLLDLHHRNQLLESAGSSSGPTWLVQRRRSSQLVLSSEDTAGSTTGAQQPQPPSASNVQATSTTTANPLAGELSILSFLLLSSCIALLTMVSICAFLIVIVIKCYKYGFSSPATRLGASSNLRNTRRNFKSTSSTCNICDDSRVGETGNMDAMLASAPTGKADDRTYCNVFAKLRANQHQTRAPTPTMPAANANSTTTTLNGHSMGQTNQTRDLILHQHTDPAAAS